MGIFRRVARAFDALLADADPVPISEPVAPQRPWLPPYADLQPGWTPEAEAALDELAPVVTSADTGLYDRREALQSRYRPETALEQAERRALEYFDVIERIERERNGWIEMYREQVAEHLTAQSMLEHEVIALRRTATRAILMLNEQRKEAGLVPISGPDDLVPYTGEPVGTMERYAARMLELREQAAAPIDGLAERDAITVAAPLPAA
jgi:hypothetical protein